MTDEGIWTYRARVNRVVDGDTLYVTVDHGMHILSVQSLRVARYDAPELFSGTPEERAQGAEAKLWVEVWVKDHASEGEWPLRITTNKDRRSFNRYVAVVHTPAGRDLAADWIEAHP